MDCTLTPVERQVGYVISYKDNVNKLKEQAKRLLDERKALQHRVDAARGNAEEIEGPVDEWLSKVKEYASKAKILLDDYDKRHKRNAEEIEGEDLKWPDDIASKAKELLDEDDKRSKTAWCSSKSFSSMCWRHQISRKAKKLAEEIANIKGEKEFTQVSHPGELNITETLASSAENDEAFESRVAALNQIMEALANPNLRLIGVHGLGGVGKTTLVREVAIKVTEKSPDTNVVFVDVKENPKIEKIQQDISDVLGLELKQQSLLVRATLLRQSLLCNLHTLCLDECVLENIEGIGELKGLKILSLSGSEFTNLPLEIGKLTKLQLLDLSRCVQLESIPPGVLLNLQMLEVLLMGNSFSAKWRRFGESETPRFLKLDIHTGIDTKHYFKSLLDHVGDLHVGRLANLKNVVLNINEKDETSSKVQQKKTQVGDENILDPPVVLFSHKAFIPNLETLNISGASKLNKLWDQQFDRVSFRNLKTLNLKYCDAISKLLPFNVLENLEELEVSYCDSLEVIFDLEGTRKEETHDVVKPSHLRKLTLDYLPSLKHVWNKDPKKIVGFQCLSIIEASECDSLKYLFPASVAKALPKLHFLSITSCCELETIVGREEEGADVLINFVFARVTELHLQRLPKLKSFYPGTYSTEWPILQKLYCKFVGRSWNIFGSGLLGFEEFHCQNGLEVSIQLSLAIQKSIPMLRELKLDCYKNMMAWIQRYLPDICWNELKILKLKFFHDVPLWTFIQSMYALETLHVKCGSLEEIFPHEREVIDITQHGRGIHIKTLTIDRLSKLKHICGEGNEPNPILERLEELYISKCSGLSNLVPSSIKFNHLASIAVFGCNGILHLISSFTAKSLSRLTTMQIRQCKMIKEIVAGKVTDDEITFSKLKTLTVDNLPRLESFCPLNCVFNFPALENVVIAECPKLKLFSKQAPITTNLRSVKHGIWRGVKSYWEDDLNSTVQKLYTDKLYYGLVDLNFSEYPELKQIWHTQLPNGAFCKLKTLTLSNCEWSSKVLQWNVLKCLVGLKNLKVESCKSVEVVFDLEGAKDEERDYVLAMSTLTLTSLPNLKHIWNKDPRGILDFPQLTRLKLADVPKLGYNLVEKAIPNLKRLGVDKAIMTWFRQFLADRFNSLEVLGLQFLNDVNTRFPYSVLQKMSNLKVLMVKDALFEEICPFKRQVVEGNHGGVVQLQVLWVKNLQKLRHICEEGYELDPSLKHVEVLFVEECSSLLNLGPSSLTLNFLKQLRVKKCEQLSYLMTPSTAKSLGKLEHLIIEDCSMIKEIILGKVVNAQTIDEITFSRLEVLMLKNLPCLESFCSMNYAFNFPCLEDLVIWQCPNLKKFSNGVSSTPNLERIVGEGCGDLFEFDLNSTGQETYKYEILKLCVTYYSLSRLYLNLLELDISEDTLLDVDTDSKNEQLDESDRNSQFEGEDISKYDFLDVDSESDKEHLNESDQLEVEEEDNVKEYKEQEEEKEENINGCVTEQSTISYPESRDIDLQSSTNEGKGGSQKKIEDMNVIEQSTTSYSENMEAHTKQKQGFEISIRNFDSKKRLQEQHINFRESMGETTNIDDDKGLPLEILTEATSSLDSIIEEPMSELVLMDRQEGLEQNQVTIEFLGRTDVIPEAAHNAIELINRSVSTVSTSKELQGLGRCSPISQPFSSIANVAGSLEVKPTEVVQSTQDCQESDSNGSKSNSVFQTQTMTRHGGELQSKEVHQEPKKQHISPTNLGEEIPKKEPNSELVLTDQQLTLEGNKASSELQPLATNSHLSPISGYPPSNSYQSLNSVAETSGPPLTSNAAVPSPIEDLLSQLHLFSSYEEMSYLHDGFSRYPWALHLLESWSDDHWKWSYFIIFAHVLCILQTTRAADLSETLNAELNSSLNTLESVGFNANWIAAIRGRIHHCQAGLTNVNEAKALKASKDVIASRLTEFELAMGTELAKYAQREELARNVIGLP
ncbi:hypothetical protein L6164_003144 [Bauhinia variegata]|uniref:Uncharacterized protein n=1 Tax=Bauhinia variegata TaxID=167791 RepID=A0ACB9PZX4_BAUVA|nr:hypothetical protein L6164_003144 [Bauhinia variegata]